MNKKIFKIMVIMIIMLLICAGLMNSAYAADEPNPCVVDFGRTYPITPSNPLPGQEITIQPVIKDITYPIAMVSFVIDYDSTKIMCQILGSFLVFGLRHQLDGSRTICFVSSVF